MKFSLYKQILQIVVDAIEKSYVKNALFKPLLTEIMEKAATFPYLFYQMDS